MKNKQILAILCASIMVLIAIPAFSFAEEGEEQMESSEISEEISNAVSPENSEVVEETVAENNLVEALSENSSEIENEENLENQNITEENEILAEDTTNSTTETEEISDCSVNGHKYGEEVVFLEPTTEHQGVKEKCCLICGKWEMTFIPKLEVPESEKEHVHDFNKEITKPATCVETGTVVYTCKDETCGYSYEEVLPINDDHDTELVTVDRKEPTNSEDGYYSWEIRCKLCGKVLNSKTEVLKKRGSEQQIRTSNSYCAKYGHSYGVETVAVEPTTEHVGATVSYCTICNAKRVRMLNKLAAEKHEYENTKEECTHTWNSGTVKKKANCSEDGLMVYKCTLCGETKEETIAANGEHYGDSVTVVSKKEATCSTDGYMRWQVKCKYCGIVLTTGKYTYPATGETNAEETPATGETNAEETPATGETNPLATTKTTEEKTASTKEIDDVNTSNSDATTEEDVPASSDYSEQVSFFEDAGFDESTAERITELLAAYNEQTPVDSSSETTDIDDENTSDDSNMPVRIAVLEKTVEVLSDVVDKIQSLLLSLLGSN